MAEEIVNSREETIPVFSGSEILSFGVSQMPPEIQIFVYVNNIEITPFCAPTSPTNARIGDPIYTDKLGAATGYIYIPATEGKYKFPSGEIRLTFGDTSAGIEKCKYVSESTLFNHGLTFVDLEQGSTVSLRRVERFRSDNTGTVTDDTGNVRRLDPLAQTFVVDQEKHPLGVMLTGAALFFFKKDENLPVGVEIRPMKNGKPSQSEFMSGSFAAKNPEAVEIFDTATNQVKPTIFGFQHPITLRPGEYALCVTTKSDKYELLTAKLGDGKTVKQPFAGTLFKPQNTGEWVGDTNEDLMFVLLKAKFEPGSVTFVVESPQLPQLEFDRLRLLSSGISFGTTAYTDYRIQTTRAGDKQKSGYKTILPNGLVNSAGTQTAEAEGDVSIEVTMTTKSEDVAPVLDQQLLKAQAFRTVVRPYSAAVSDSELTPYPTTSFADSRYVSKVIPLEISGSNGIQVTLDVNRKPGTDIEVFARVLSKEDQFTPDGMNGRNWVRIPLISPSTKTFAGNDNTVFYTETYKLLSPGFDYSPSVDLESTAVDETTYVFTSFDYYQIKIVFYANDPAILPRIRNLIATSLL